MAELRRVAVEEVAPLLERRHGRSSSPAETRWPHAATARDALLALAALTICVLLLLLLWEVRATRALLSVDHGAQPPPPSAHATSPHETEAAPVLLASLSTPPLLAIATVPPPLSPSALPASAALPLSPRRYLGVLSCWERMANAVVSFGQLLDMAAATHNTMQPVYVVAPTVLHGELGFFHKREALPFDAYFDLPALQRLGLPLLSLEEFVAKADKAQVLGSTGLLPVQRLLYIDYSQEVEKRGDKFDERGLSSCANLALPDLDGDGRRRHNLTALQLGMAIDEVLCVSSHVNLSTALDAVYAQLDGSRALTVYLWQHRKLSAQANTAAVPLFDHLAPRYAQLIAAQPWAGKYAVLQMRAGSFLRCGTPECRAEAPAKMLWCAQKLANATLRAMREAGIDALVLASDLHGAVPEWFAGENYDAAFAAVAALLNSTLGGAVVTAPVSQLDVFAADYVGATTLLDFQLAVQAHTLLAMSLRKYWTSAYTAQMDQARRRAGRETVLVMC